MRFVLLVLVVSMTLPTFTVARSAEINTRGGQVKSPIDDAIIAAMEVVRNVMINGTDKIPPLDPYFVEQMFIDFQSDQAQLKLLIDNTWVTNLAQFVVDSVKTNAIRFTMDMQLSLERFNIDGHYAMDGVVANLFPLYGSGDYYIHVFNISIGGGAKLNVAGPSISNLYLDFTFESLNVKFENLLGGGSLQTLVETVIEQLAKQVVDTIWAQLSPSFCALIEQIVNDAIAGMTP